MDAGLEQLLPFLHSENSNVRQVAIANLVGHTASGSPNRGIFFTSLTSGGLQDTRESQAIRDLKLLCRDQLAIAHDAFRAVVNLSDSSLAVTPLSEPSFLEFIVSYILNPEAILADLACMLLSNLTSASTACSALLSLKVNIIPSASDPKAYYTPQSRCGTCKAPTPYPTGASRTVAGLILLVDVFSQTSSRKGELHFLASVFANITASAGGRDFFLTPGPTSHAGEPSQLEYPLTKIVAFTEHPNVIRRGGVASTLKNCSFNANAHRALLTPDSEVIKHPSSNTEVNGIGIIPFLLLPLAGPEEFDLDDQERLPPELQFLPKTKTREPESALRLMHVETLLLLCTTRWGREQLRTHGVYEIVRTAHEKEVVDKISEHIERLVNLLKRGEGPESENDKAQDQQESEEDGRIIEV